MCFTNIKNIGDIYYSRNLDNFHNKTNSILVENGPLDKLILILSFEDSKKINYINIVMSTFLNRLKGLYN